MHSPMEQFEIKRLISFHIGSLDASYTNSALWMTIAVIVAFLLFVVGVRQRALRSEEHTSELQSLAYLVCRLLL